MPDIVQTCRITGKNFSVSEWEQKFLERMKFPFPALCIDERLRRRLSYRNERSLSKRTCDLTKKPILSLYHADSPFIVYSQDAWWSDRWDAKSFGRPFDFNRPFFEQFAELQRSVPRIALLNTKGENSEYCNITTSNKNCYLVFGGDFNEDCFCSNFNFHSRNVCDVYWVDQCELVYEGIDCHHCYNLSYAQNCHRCRDSAFLYDCRGCENCFGCINLNNKKYHIFNESYSPEAYRAKIAEFKLDTWNGVERMKKEFEIFKLSHPHRYAHIVNAENSTGNNLTNVKNCINCFDVAGPAEDLKDIFEAGNIRDSLSCDHVGHGNTQLFYEMLGSIDGYNCAFCSFAWTCRDVFYCDFVHNSNNLFGCTNMKRAEYCIFNKPYSKEEYEKMRNRIIEHMKKTGEWGEYFPIQNSPFAYNETVAYEYFPLTKEEALKHGYRWRDPDPHEYQKQIYQIPDSIAEVPENILNETLACQDSGTASLSVAGGKNYRIVPQELRFYQQMKIPIPRKCSDCRHRDRLAKRLPPRLFERNCSKCQAQIHTPFSPERRELLYCEKCYLETVY